MSSNPPTQVLTTPDVRFLKPLPVHISVPPSGRIEVEGYARDQSHPPLEVWVGIFTAGDLPDLTTVPPANTVRCQLTGMRFSAAGVGCLGGPIPCNISGVALKVAAYVNFCGTWSRYTMDITAHCDNTPTTVTVNAQSSIWFAWAPAGFLGPVNEGEMNRPTSVAIPVDSNNHKPVSVLITAAGDHNWGHGDEPGCITDAQGRPNVSVGLEISLYKDSADNGQYRSSGINLPGVLPVNQLVALVEYNNTPATIGSPQTIQGIPLTGSVLLNSNPTRLFLAMHDGRRWTNNVGLVRVTLAWEFPPGP